MFKDKVVEIRKLYSSGFSMGKIAKEFLVSECCIRKVIRRIGCYE